MNKLKERKGRFQYQGKLEDYQLKLEKEGKYQPIVQTETKYQLKSYTKYQNNLYRRALYGLGALNQEDLATLCPKKRHRINRVYYKGQVAINLHKQKITNSLSTSVFEKWFPDSPITAFFKQNTELDPKHKNTLTFKDLGINKDEIITIFIDSGVLPKNFYQLKKDPNQLPRLKNASKEENM